MAQQALPLISGGNDANKVMGNVFVLWLRHPNEIEAAACRGAAEAAGVKAKELDAREYVVLYPESHNKSLRLAGVNGLKEYIRLTPFRVPATAWANHLRARGEL